MHDDDRAQKLGVIDASLIVVGSIVGAGIFFVSGSVARHATTPGVFLGAWVLGGAVALSGALCNGELGGLFPRSGGEYVYLRQAYGPGVGFLSGWTSFWIVFPGSIAALASGFGATVAAMIGASGSRATPTAIGLVAIAALTAINAFGLRSGKWTQNVLSGAKLAAFAGLLALGFVAQRDTGAATATATVAQGGVGQALLPVLFAYSGWNAATYVAGEMRDPARGLGRALALGTTMCIALYVAVNATYLHAMPIAQLAQQDEPARAAAVRLGGSTAAALLSPLIAVCVLSSMQASVLVGPRIYQAMASDGLFFAALGRINAALVVQSVLAAGLLVSGTFDQLLTFATFAIVVFSTLTVAAVVVLRVRNPRAPRPFRAPLVPLVPALFVSVNGWVLWSVVASGARAALIGLAIVATGWPAYLLMRARANGKGRVK